MLLPGAAQRRFETLVRAHRSDLYRYAYWLCRDRFLAEDLVQETFGRAWKAWDSLRDEKAMKGWLFSILHNEHARLYEKKRLDTEELEVDQVMADDELGVDGALSMRQALEGLHETYREPLLLQVLGGFSCAEIGEMLSLNEAAVMTRVSRARKALRELFEQEPKQWKQAN